MLILSINVCNWYGGFQGKLLFKCNLFAKLLSKKHNKTLGNKSVELQAERLKKEQDALQKEQWRLEDLEEERKKMESARGQREMG